MASWLMRTVSSPRTSSRKRSAIRCGLHACAQRRACLRPCRRPLHGAAGPVTAVPPGMATAQDRQSRTDARSPVLAARFARRAGRSARQCAVAARSSNSPLRVAALGRSSRAIVHAARPSRRATCRTPKPCARNSAITCRPANERDRPESGLAERDRRYGAIPPAVRNRPNPTGCDAPTCIAASWLDNPAATNAQNRRRRSCRATEGRPGDHSWPREARSERRRPGIATILLARVATII